MLTFTNEVAEGLVKKNLGEEALKETAQFKGDFLTFPELEAAIKDDVKYLKESKLIPDNIVISGWVHDVEHGTVTNVV